MEEEHQKTRTLVLCGILHAFTHFYHVALLPLYLLIQKDLALATVEQATFLMTAFMISYYLPSYALGVLADSMSRRWLLGIGLAINGLGFVGLAYAQTYWLALACVVLSGVGGSFYHPSATALIVRLFPTNSGRALGLIGIGASVGFFIGPFYTGWRAAATGNWRAPVLEVGLLSVIVAGLFLYLTRGNAPKASAVPRVRSRAPLFAAPALWALFFGAAFAFSLRDFAGGSMGSLGSLFLQKAHGFDSRATGFVLSSIFLAGMISSPLFGRLSDGGRYLWAAVVLGLAAVMVALVPHVEKSWIVPVYAVFGFFFIANFPIVEAALLESVPDAMRGRVFGLFIAVGGFVGNLSHWVAGKWVKDLGPAANSPGSYLRLYALLAAMIFLSMLGLLCLRALRSRGILMRGSGEIHAEASRELH